MLIAEVVLVLLLGLAVLAAWYGVRWVRMRRAGGVSHPNLLRPLDWLQSGADWFQQKESRCSNLVPIRRNWPQSRAEPYWKFGMSKMAAL